MLFGSLPIILLILRELLRYLEKASFDLLFDLSFLLHNLLDLVVSGVGGSLERLVFSLLLPGKVMGSPGTRSVAVDAGLVGTGLRELGLVNSLCMPKG